MKWLAENPWAWGRGRKIFVDDLPLGCFSWGRESKKIGAFLGESSSLSKCGPGLRRARLVKAGRRKK